MSNNYRAVITPRSLLQIITEAATTDPRVATCRLSDTFAAEQKSDDPVPLLLVEFDRSTIEQKGTLNTIDWRVYVACFVKRRTDGDNLIEGQSESWNILLDLFYRLKNSDVLRDLGISLPKDNATPISLPSSLHRQDYIGWNLELLFRTPLTLSACDIPGGDLPDYGLAYSGSPVVGNQYLTCATLGSCSLISDMIASIAALSGGTGSTTYVQPGSNTYTGGTATRPSVNVVTDPFFGDVTANNLTAATLISSPQVSADLGIFSDLEIDTFTVSNLTVTKHLYVGQLAEEIFGPTYVQNGTNTTTGGTEMRPTVDVVADPTFTDVTASSLLVGTINATTLGSGTINGGLILSGGSDLSTIIQRSRTRIIPGTNTTTGGTLGAQTVDVVSSPSFVSISASTIFSGGVDLSRYLTGSTQVRVQGGTNITTGGTAFAPTINVVPSPSFTSVSTGSLDVGGTANIGTVNAGAIDASFLFSGGTNLSSLLTGGSQSLGVRTSTATSITPGLSDANGLLIASAATAITVLIPTNATVAFPIGTQIMFEQGSTGQVRFSGATGVTLNSYGNAYNLVGQYATAFVTLTSSNRWVLDGNLTTLNL